MIDKVLLKEIEQLDCSTCLNEIPHSEKNNAEVDDYVRNYCGVECYVMWSDDEH